MDSPFPGMDPYLEQHWRAVHHRLITYAGDELQTALPRRFRVEVEERVFVIVIDLPDEAVTETFIEIIDAASGNKVITAIEFISPTNKESGEGNDLFVRKQREYRAAGVSQVEIDLTRQGDRSIALPLSRIPPLHRTLYFSCVRKSWQSTRIEIYPMPLQQSLPPIGIPLDPSLPDVTLNLQSLVAQCYRNGRYDDLDYRAPLVTPLPPADAAWTDELLRSKGLR